MGLFTPKWLKNSSETGKLTDQEKLKKAAEQGNTSEVRITALNRITDQEFLYDTLSSLPPGDLNDEQKIIVSICLDKFRRQNRSLMIKAATQLSGMIRTLAQSYLSESEAYSVLPECGDEIACELFALIKDPEKIIEIAQLSERPALVKAALDRMVKERAALSKRQKDREENRIQPEREIQQYRYWYYNKNYFKGLSDESILDVADNADDDVIRENAVYYLKNQEMLKQIVLSEKYSDRQKECAVIHIDDPAFISRIIQDGGYSEKILREAVRKVDDPELLRMVTESKIYPDWVRWTAVYGTKFPEQYYIDIAWNGDCTLVRKEAINRISSRDELIKIRDEIGEPELKQCACGKIGHEFESYITTELSKRGKGHRNHFMKRCVICGLETEEDVVEYDD